MLPSQTCSKEKGRKKESISKVKDQNGCFIQLQKEMIYIQNSQAVKKYTPLTTCTMKKNGESKVATKKLLSW